MNQATSPLSINISTGIYEMTPHTITMSLFLVITLCLAVPRTGSRLEAARRYHPRHHESRQTCQPGVCRCSNRQTHTLLPSDVSGPCFSPDGQSIAFIYKDMIYVAPRHDIDARREITPKSAYKTIQLTSSGHIYFAEGGAIYRIHALARVRRKVASMPSHITKKKKCILQLPQCLQ